MKVLIDIDDKDYADIMSDSERNLNHYERLIKKGVPLPKGHGDLVDISPYKGKVICSHLYSGVKKLIEVDSIKPIIEADKEIQNE